MLVLVWMIPFPLQTQGYTEERYEGSSVSRKTDKEGYGVNMLCFPWQRMEYLCSVAQQKEHYSSKAACQSSTQLIKARAPPPPSLSISNKNVELCLYLGYVQRRT